MRLTRCEEVVEGLKNISIIKQVKRMKLKISGLFIAIGHKPNTDIFKSQLDMDHDGYLITSGKSTRTNLPVEFLPLEMYRIKNTDKQ